MTNYNLELYKEIVDNIVKPKLSLYDAKDMLCDIFERYEIHKKEVNPNNYDLTTNIKLFIDDKTVQNLSKTTLYGYTLQLNKFTRFTTKKIQDITKEDILQYFEWIKTQNPSVKASTLEAVRYILQVFFNWLKDERKIKESPMERIRPFKVEKKIGRTLNITELEMVRDCCETPRSKSLLEFTYATGLRLSEIVSVDKSDIDWVHNRIKIMGKGSKERYVFMSPKCVLHLKKYLKTRDDNCDALFVTLRRPYRRLGQRAIQREIHKIGELAQLKSDISPHALRRTLTSNLVEKECPLPVVQQILGHSNISTTQRYINISQDFKQQSYNKYLYG